MRGFTLLEMTLVIGLMGTIASMTAFQDVTVYKRVLARTDAGQVMGALIRARGEAMHGLCSSNNCETPPPHGVWFGEHSVVEFEGTSYANRTPDTDEQYPLAGTRVVPGTQEIIFSPISGEAVESGSVHLTDTTGATWQVDVTQSGVISVK